MRFENPKVDEPFFPSCVTALSSSMAFGVAAAQVPPILVEMASQEDDSTPYPAIAHGNVGSQAPMQKERNNGEGEEVMVQVKHAVQGGIDSLVEIAKNEILKILMDVVLKDLAECFDENLSAPGSKLKYSVGLDLSFNSASRPVVCIMSANRRSGADEADPLPKGLVAGGPGKQQQPAPPPQRATVGGIPVENFDRMHRGAVHRPDRGTPERPSASNLQPWLQTPKSWGLRYNVDLQNDVGAMSTYVPKHDVSSLRGGTMVPKGTDASWQIRITRLGKRFTTRIGIVNTSLKVREDWYQPRVPAAAWYMCTSGDMYEDINPKGSTGKTVMPGDVLGVHLMWSWDGTGLVRFTLNNMSLPGEIRGVEAPCHLAVQLLNKGDTVALVSEELRAEGSDYRVAPAPPPWTGHVPGSVSRLTSARGLSASASSTPRPPQDEASRLRLELASVMAQKEAITSLLREMMLDDAIRLSTRPASAVKRPKSVGRELVTVEPSSVRGPLLASDRSDTDRAETSMSASQGLSASMESRQGLVGATPRDRFLAEHQDRSLVPYRYGKPDAEGQIMSDNSIIFGGGWAPGVTTQSQRVAKMQKKSSEHAAWERGVGVSHHVRYSKNGDEVQHAMVELARRGGLGAPNSIAPPEDHSQKGMAEPKKMLRQRPVSAPATARSRGGKVEKAILAAAKMGDAEECNILLALVEAEGERARLGSVALRAAASEGHTDTVASLADMWGGGSANLGGPLLAAAQAGQWSVCDSLLGRGCSVDHKSDEGGGEFGCATPLIVAACHDRFEVVQGLLSRGAAVNAIDADGYSALMWACFKGSEAVGSLLIDAGADVSIASKQGNTALIYAAYTACEGLVIKLLEHGASPRHANDKGLRATDVALQQCHQSLASLLDPVE